MRDIRLTREFLSSYYVAILIFSSIFGSLKWFKETVGDLQFWLNSFVETFIENANGSWVPWLCLFLACFAIVSLIRKFVVMPLGLYVKEEGAVSWELAVLTFLVFGSLLYYLNIYFKQPMPADLPETFVKLFGGYHGNISYQEAKVWSVVPYIWTLGPILFMYIMHKQTPPE